MHHALLRDAPRISHSIKIGVLSHNEEVSDFEQNYQNRGSFYFIYPRFTGFFLTVHFVAYKQIFSKSNKEKM